MFTSFVNIKHLKTIIFPTWCENVIWKNKRHKDTLDLSARKIMEGGLVSTLRKQEAEGKTYLNLNIDLPEG